MTAHHVEEHAAQVDRNEAARLRAEEMIRMTRAAVSVLRAAASRLTIWYKRQRLYEELDGLSDYVLADMGMTRANLRTTVKKSYPYPSLAFAAHAQAANDDQDERSVAA